MAKGRDWTREETILAFDLYCKTPFGRMHKTNPDVINLAELIDRTPSSIAMRLVNFASLDPSLEQRGLSNASRLDEAVFNEFSNDWGSLSFECSELLAQYTGQRVEEAVDEYEPGLPKEGKEREAIVKTRVNQSFFRRTVLTAYDNRCCITGLSITELLISSHIVPWSRDQENRVNPRNGLCLNALHDKAFDSGLLTITPDFKVKLSSEIAVVSEDHAYKDFLKEYDNKPIHMPNRFLPDPALLEWHNREIFRGKV